MLKSILGAVVFAAFVSPAMANEYWVEYNYSTHECSIVEKKTPQSAAEATQTGPATNPPPDVAASGTPNNSPLSSVPQGFAAPTKEMPPVVASGNANTPNNANTPSNANTDTANTPSITPGSVATTVPTAPASPTDAPNGAAAPGAPSPTDNTGKKLPQFDALAASWEAKKAAAEAAGTANVTTIEIGTAMQSREEAQAEMQVMRKCGLRN